MINYNQYMVFPYKEDIMFGNRAQMQSMMKKARKMQEEMKKIENCLECGQYIKKCPYELNTPELLKKNYEDYKKVLAGEVSVN